MEAVALRGVPLSKAVNSAIIDLNESPNLQQKFQHWAVRSLKTLNRQVLKVEKKYAILTINSNTKTAALPCDFYEELRVGTLDCWGKFTYLDVREDITPTSVIDKQECDTKCQSCGQDKSPCNDLEITEDVTLVIVNNQTVEQKIIKKLSPDGSYLLEARIPVWDEVTQSVIYNISKDFITKFDMLPCGCMDNTQSNLEKLQCHCTDVYYRYYGCDTGCGNQCDNATGGYKIFPELGFVQVDGVGEVRRIYIEYYGFLPKKNGQYIIPEVAFETVVESLKFKYVDGKRNVPNVDKQWRWQMFRNAKSNMEKELGRVSLGQILQAITRTPKFDITFDNFDCCPCVPALLPPASTGAEDTTTGGGTTGGGTTGGGTTGGGKGRGNYYQVPLVVSTAPTDPTPGDTVFVYQPLIGAKNLNFIIVNNAIETQVMGDFTFDSNTGTITRVNPWQLGDTIILNFTK